ncbi:MAG: AbrB family transcriptional regulator [Proteobacteria bacterium]|nr:AbrB family transcriptional regulator [Pseudomonadota bacterium]
MSEIPASLGRVALALGIGVAGGWFFSILTMPLPWMLGSMAFCTIAAVMRAPIEAPVLVRPYMIAIVGVMLGSGYSPEMLDRAGEWLVSLGMLGAYVAAVGGVGLAYFRLFTKYDPVTAYFCAMPGGFNEMVMMGTEMGGDERKIALTHASRVLLVVFTVPLWLRLTGQLDIMDRMGLGVGLGGVAPADYLLLAACGLGWPIAAKLRLPAAALVGPMILSGALHLSGLTATQPPMVIVNLAQLFIGVTVGCRFTGATTREVTHALGIGSGLAAIMLILTALFAWVIEAMTGTPFPVAVLAFSPGGLAEMSLIGLALGVDVAFIATHHVIRIFMVILLAPTVIRLWRR